MTKCLLIFGTRKEKLVMKMKGKRLAILITESLAGLMGAMSAIGGSCPAFNPERILETEPGEMLKASSIALNAVMTQYQWAFILLNILTYLAAAATLVMIWALIKRKEWFYNAALITAVVGCVTGLIPFLMVILNEGSTPSFMRAIIYGVVILLLLIPGFRKELKDNITNIEKIDSGETNANVAAVLFFPGALIWIQSFFIAPSHMLGNNVKMFYSLQIGTSLVLMAVGILIFSISKIRNRTVMQ